jgi:hypothetical protein
MNTVALAAVILAAAALPAQAQKATTDTPVDERIQAEAAAKDAKIKELQAQLEKAQKDRSLAIAELQSSRQQAVKLSADLSDLENKHVELARERKLLEEKILSLGPDSGKPEEGKKLFDQLKKQGEKAPEPKAAPAPALPAPATPNRWAADERYRLAESYYLKGQLEQADLECRRAIQADLDHLPARTLLQELAFLRTGGPAKKGAPAAAGEVVRVIALLLEQAYLAFEQKAFDRCIGICDAVLSVDAHYTVARELKEDARKASEKTESYELLAKKVAEWKKLTNSATGTVPWAQTLGVADPPPPPAAARNSLDGKVTAVADGIGLVVISLGRDDGVAEGDEFTVYREGDFVARILVDRTDRKWSAGKVILKKSDPKVGDDASNHILVSAARGQRPSLSKSSAEELRAIRKELDDVRIQVRALSGRLIPSWQGVGVTVEEASEELRAHLALTRGLVVRQVRPGSAAEKAGLLANDVLPEVSEAQAIQALETGSSVKVIRRGQPITLGGAKNR